MNPGEMGKMSGAKKGKEQILNFKLDKNSILNGIVFSEIIGKPKALAKKPKRKPGV